MSKTRNNDMSEEMTVYENRGGEVWERHPDGRRELFAADIITKLTTLEQERNDAMKLTRAIKYCLWNYDSEKKHDISGCGKWLKTIDSETYMTFCPFCGSTITAM